MTTHRTAGPALPLKIVYNTDYYDPEPEDLAIRYILSVQDANEKTVIYTDSGYFKLDQGVADYVVRACNAHAGLVEALKNTIEELRTFQLKDANHLDPILVAELIADGEAALALADTVPS